MGIQKNGIPEFIVSIERNSIHTKMHTFSISTDVCVDVYMVSFVWLRSKEPKGSKYAGVNSSPLCAIGSNGRNQMKSTHFKVTTLL